MQIKKEGKREAVLLAGPKPVSEPSPERLSLWVSRVKIRPFMSISVSVHVNILSAVWESSQSIHMQIIYYYSFIQTPINYINILYVELEIAVK